jgi:hypothetical protein
MTIPDYQPGEFGGVAILRPAAMPVKWLKLLLFVEVRSKYGIKF